MTLAAWSAVAAICALGAMTPGPSLAVISRHALSGGRAAGAAAALAHALAIGIYAFASISGIAVLVASGTTAYAILQWGGAAWLAWMGVRALFSAPGDPVADTPATTRRGAARDGFLVAFLNPKVAIFFLALFSQVVGPDTATAERVLVASTAMVIDGGWYLLVAWGLTRPRWLSWLRRHGPWLDRLFGVLLLGLAIRLVWQAVTGP
ncbi:LysE family translocator [Marinihelvus fidelis]|uniref:LysE family translocator n=1 Tax=Marinihelvus fidelis TaxID=2613842 RepID=A0A5N0TEB1_9GAMM|nr:LysE family translocator [Marinihelvus fidelis]KAA9133372.1 LysE family translocator [Marinihelvus fidelis]